MPNKFITACHSSDKSSDMVVEDMNAYDTRDKLETKTNFTQLNKEQAVKHSLDQQGRHLYPAGSSCLTQELITSLMKGYHAGESDWNNNFMRIPDVDREEHLSLNPGRKRLFASDDEEDVSTLNQSISNKKDDPNFNKEDTSISNNEDESIFESEHDYQSDDSFHTAPNSLEINQHDGNNSTLIEHLNDRLTETLFKRGNSMSQHLNLSSSANQEQAAKSSKGKESMDPRHMKKRAVASDDRAFRKLGSMYIDRMFAQPSKTVSSRTSIKEDRIVIERKDDRSDRPNQDKKRATCYYNRRPDNRPFAYQRSGGGQRSRIKGGSKNNSDGVLTKRVVKGTNPNRIPIKKNRGY